MPVIGIDAEVLSVDPHSLDEVLAAVEAVGRAAGAAAVAEGLAAGLRARLAAVERGGGGADPVPGVLVLEWTDPPFLPGHWVPELVRGRGRRPVGGGAPGGRSVATGGRTSPTRTSSWWRRAATASAARWRSAATVAERLPGAPLVAIDSARYVVQPGPALVDGVEALAWALHPDALLPPPSGRIAARPR